MKKDQKAKGFKNSLAYNVLLIAALTMGLYFFFFAVLGQITGHGEEVKVPNITGKSLKDGKSQLEKIGFDIQVDSSYDPRQNPLTIIGQQPEVGEIVKPGRTIFLTVNKAEPPKTPMPNLNGLSLRSAIMILNSSKLKLGDTTYRPDIAQGAVLDQLFNGEIIRAGQMIPQGSIISLVLGDGLGNTVFDVPDIVGLTFVEAVAMLSANNLQYTAIASEDISDTSSAYVYRQMPSALNELGEANRLREGDEVGFYFKQNPSETDFESGPSGAPVNDTTPKPKMPAAKPVSMGKKQ
ncbi:MAG: PASTA domain-containing protein [Chitinophagaceae bacterium]|nr:PASTA domain-containing protein [Chitinophagaceae bacterium]